ncbi:hypothetical protein A7Q09_05435 [Methylacidiphilum sp. Yel]|nr:hypothetical protein A7Q09_05435 [Methylacidiphilum sp. Yel]
MGRLEAFVTGRMMSFKKPVLKFLLDRFLLKLTLKMPFVISLLPPFLPTLYQPKHQHLSPPDVHKVNAHGRFGSGSKRSPIIGLGGAKP